MLDLIRSIEGLAATVAFLVIIYWPWQFALEDRARDAIFERRERLFDMALSGKLDFGSPEYRFVRASFEDCIRYAHKVTWGRVALYIRARGHADPANAVGLIAERIADAEVREQVKQLVFEVQREVFFLLVARSPALLTLVLMVGAYLAATKGMNQARSYLSAKAESFGSLIQTEAAASAG